MKNIENLHNLFINNLYNIKKLKENIKLPDEVDIKNIMIYYIQYLYYAKIGDTYFDELIEFVCIPHNYLLEINSIEEYINMHHYIKYNICNLDVKLNNKENITEDIILEIDEEICKYYNMKVSQLKRECKNLGIKKFYKLRKSELIEKLKKFNQN